MLSGLASTLAAGGGHTSARKVKGGGGGEASGIEQHIVVREVRGAGVSGRRASPAPTGGRLRFASIPATIIRGITRRLPLLCVVVDAVRLYEIALSYHPVDSEYGRWDAGS